jgi:hypothetical protein
MRRIANHRAESFGKSKMCSDSHVMWALVNPSSRETRATEAPCVEFNVPKVDCLRKGLLNVITLNVTYPHAVTSPLEQFKYPLSCFTGEMSV